MEIETTKRHPNAVSWKSCDWSSSCESLGQSVASDGGEEASSLSELSDNNVGFEGGRCLEEKVKRRLQHLDNARWSHCNQLDNGGEGSSCSSLSQDSCDAKINSSEDLNELEEEVSISVSTTSDGAVESIADSSLGESNSASEDTSSHSRSRAPLPDDASARITATERMAEEVSSLSSGVSDASGHPSSSIEVQFAGDDDSDEDEDELWKEFEAAIGHLQRPVSLIHMDTTRATDDDFMPSHLVEITYDEGYDGSASESGSDEIVSLTSESISGPSASQAGLAETYDNASVESRNSGISPSLSSSFAFEQSTSTSSSLSLSSAASGGDSVEDNQLSLESLSDVGEICNGNSLRIENIPVILSPDPAHPHHSPHAVEVAAHWRASEFFDASARYQWSSNDSLDLESEDVESLDGQHVAKISVRDKSEPIVHHDLVPREWYVSFYELSGVLDQYCAEQSGVALDFGCGTSRVCEELVYRGYRHVFAVDKSHDVIAFQRRQQASIQLCEYLHFFLMASTDTLLFPDKYFDLIISKATLDEIAGRGLRFESAHELVETLVELARCLKPGGILLAVVNLVGLLDDDWESDEAEPPSDRVTTPWWKWNEVRSVLSRQLLLVDQFDVGQPRFVDGVRTKPFQILVWRRAESYMEQMRRVLRELKDVLLRRQEYDLRIAIHSCKQARICDEERMIVESRQMILEDETSRRREAKELEVRVRDQCEQYRASFYASLEESESKQMACEDSEGLSRREHFKEIVSIISQTIERAIKSSVAIAAMVEPAGQTQFQTTLDQALGSPIAKTSEILHSAWIRQIAMQLIDEIIRSTSVNRNEPLLTGTPCAQPATTLVVSAKTSSAASAESAVLAAETLDSIISGVLSTQPGDSVNPLSGEQDAVATDSTCLYSETRIEEACCERVGSSSAELVVSPLDSATESPATPTAPSDTPHIEVSGDAGRAEIEAACSAALEAILSLGTIDTNLSLIH